MKISNLLLVVSLFAAHIQNYGNDRSIDIFEIIFDEKLDKIDSKKLKNELEKLYLNKPKIYDMELVNDEALHIYLFDDDDQNTKFNIVKVNKISSKQVSEVCKNHNFFSLLYSKHIDESRIFNIGEGQNLLADSNLCDGEEYRTKASDLADFCEKGYLLDYYSIVLDSEGNDKYTEDSFSFYTDALCKDEYTSEYEVLYDELPSNKKGVAKQICDPLKDKRNNITITYLNYSEALNGNIKTVSKKYNIGDNLYLKEITQSCDENLIPIDLFENRFTIDGISLKRFENEDDYRMKEFDLKDVLGLYNHTSKSANYHYKKCFSRLKQLIYSFEKCDEKVKELVEKRVDYQYRDIPQLCKMGYLAKIDYNGKEFNADNKIAYQDLLNALDKDPFEEVPIVEISERRNILNLYECLACRKLIDSKAISQCDIYSEFIEAKTPYSSYFWESKRSGL